MTPTEQKTLRQLGQRIKAKRRAAGLTLQELADEAGISKTYLWEIETSADSVVGVFALAGISRALGVSIDWLVTGEESLCAKLAEAQINMTVDRLGGEVEGRPTHRGNFLQRVDELVAKESENNRLWEMTKELGRQAGAAVTVTCPGCHQSLYYEAAKDGYCTNCGPNKPPQCTDDDECPIHPPEAP